MVAFARTLVAHALRVVRFCRQRMRAAVSKARPTPCNPACVRNAAATCITKRPKKVRGNAPIATQNIQHQRDYSLPNRYQFENRPAPISATKTNDGWVSTGISYDDYKGMSLGKRKHTTERRLPTPIWAVNDPMFRRLIVRFMEERAGLRKKQKGGLRERLNRAQETIVSQRPRLVALLVSLCKDFVKVKDYGAYPDKTQTEIAELAAQINGTRTPSAFHDHNLEICNSKRIRDLEIEIEGIDTYLRIHENGGAGFIVSIVYLYYRVGMDSVGVGMELGLKPPHVRQTLWRLHQTAEKLFPASHAPVENEGVATPNPITASANTDAARAGFATPLIDFNV